MSITHFLKNHIRQHGPMDLEQFMGIVLKHYYSKGDPFGAGGDFTTAPEISQMFGEMLGAWAADIWMNEYAPDSVDLLELGPGRGTLMTDAIRAAKSASGFLETLRLHCLEMSPVLKQKQAEALQKYEVCWHESLTSIPDHKSLIILANEFLDALPVRHLQFDGAKWDERVIALEGDAFVWGLRKAGPDLTAMVKNIPVSPKKGDIAEIAPARMQFMRNLFGLFKKTGGYALFIDYGYTRPAYGETLQGVYKHGFCDVLDHIGEADLTAHVDFAALQDLAAECGLTCYGVVEQGEFLKRLGIEARAGALLQKASDKQAEDIQKALHRLVNSDEMGSLFKVIGFGYGTRYLPAGFHNG